MGKIVSNFFISLDGVVESPHEWHFDYFNDEMGAAIGKGMETTAAWLMGRVLYDEWSEHWPKQGPDVPFSSFINEIPKFVLSTTLTDPSWKNTTVVSGDVAARLREIKDDTDGDIGMSGSATTVRWLIANDLLDELHLLMHPIAVGRGRRLFEEMSTRAFELIEQETFTTGVLNLSYRVARAGS